MKQTYTEAPRELEIYDSCDILVVGSGAAGHSAAIVLDLQPDHPLSPPETDLDPAILHLYQFHQYIFADQSR